MNKFYILTLALALSGATVSAAPNSWKNGTSLQKDNAEKTYSVNPEQAPRKVKSLAAENTTWLPGNLDIYESYNAGKTWELLDSYKYTYENGLAIVEETKDARTLITYNEHGKWIEKIIQTPLIDENGSIVDWENSERNVRAYDEIVTSFQTLRADYVWDITSKSWQLYYKHDKVVTRNDKGNVESVIIRSYLDEEEYIDIEGIKVLYDQKGLASAIIQYNFDYDLMTMVSNITYQDFVWEECGQIMSAEYLCLNDVRAKSYNISYDGTILASAEVTYNNDNGLFKCMKVTTDAFDPDYSEFYSLTKLDQYGSYEEMAGMESSDEAYAEKLVEEFDQYGNQINYAFYNNEDGEWVMIDCIKSTPTYDGAKLMEMLVEITNPDTGVLDPAQKYVYSNYFEDAGITNIEDTATKVFYNSAEQTIHILAGTPVAYEIYTIDGRCVATGSANTIAVDNLKSGIYIAKIANTTPFKFAK